MSILTITEHPLPSELQLPVCCCGATHLLPWVHGWAPATRAVMHHLLLSPRPDCQQLVFIRVHVCDRCCCCSQLEAEGLLPVPVFINGVEAHTVVRDQLTSDHEQAAIASGQLQRGTLRRDAVKVDTIVSTIGFPLVGGPAGEPDGCSVEQPGRLNLGP